MARTLAEITLQRALDYLALNGLPLERDTVLHAMQLVEEGLREHDAELLPWVIQQLQGRFNIAPAHLPSAQPPIKRGSIGFDAPA